MLSKRRRILIIGCGGSGKSTLARRIASLTQLPVIHLDRYYWSPGWQPTPPAKWESKVRELARKEAWIIDGNYSGTLSIRLARCDAVVFLDCSRATCLLGALKRGVLRRGRRRPDLADGCVERVDLTFLRWIWDYGNRSRPKILNALKSLPKDVDVIVLNRRKDAEDLLDELRQSVSSPERVHALRAAAHRDGDE